MHRLFKFYLYVSFCGVALMVAVSCNKAIDLKQVGQQTEDSVIRDQSDLFALLNQGYVALASDNYYGGLYQIYSELLADDLDGSALSGFYLAAYSHNVTIFNTDIINLYAQINEPVLQANQTLEHISLATDTASKQSLIGQAKFLRALCQFDLVRLWAQPYTTSGDNAQAGIPIRLTSARQKYPRSSVAAVYQQIVTDLKSADSLLPSSNGVYATRYSAEALLAKVYFQMNDFTDAYAYANEVVSSGQFGFDTSYTQRYSPKGSTETVFGLIYEANNPTGRFQDLHNNYYSQAATPPACRLASGYYTRATEVSADARKIWYTTNQGFYLLAKFDSSHFELPVLHITELKLIRAESAAEMNSNLSTGIQDMNDIMTRAYGAGSAYLLAPGATAADLKAATRRERELELIGEGNRIQELKREGGKGETVTIRSSPYDCTGMIFPFPVAELDYNGFGQNASGGCN